jgi:hypothetical protein
VSWCRAFSLTLAFYFLTTAKPTRNGVSRCSGRCLTTPLCLGAREKSGGILLCRTCIFTASSESCIQLFSSFLISVSSASSPPSAFPEPGFPFVTFLSAPHHVIETCQCLHVCGKIHAMQDKGLAFALCIVYVLQSGAFLFFSLPLSLSPHTCEGFCCLVLG